MFIVRPVSEEQQVMNMSSQLERSEMKVVRALEERHWKEFVDQHPQGNIFHTPEMYRVFECARHHHPELWAVVDSNARPQALITPVRVRLPNRFIGRFTTRAISYGSVLGETAAKGETALRRLLLDYKRAIGRQVLFVELRHLYDVRTLEQVFAGCGFVFEEHLDYLIDLNQTPEQLLQSIGPRTRKKIRQGLRKAEVSVGQVTERKDIARCYRLIQQSYVAAGVPLAHPSLFDAAFDILYPRGMCKFWIASVNGMDAAASVELTYKDVIYGWYGGVDRQFAHYLPGELLMWHILNWGIENGYRIYDFGGAGRPGEKYGVRDFKAKFGGQLVAYGRHRLVPVPLRLKLVETGYELYRMVSKFRQQFGTPIQVSKESVS
ncbi:MAG: GNAT family N-acetyltransferase [Chloroflexi bacterium]|nr:GNAT family N-acetyltransferase [Chloroflexota bacterium]